MTFWNCIGKLKFAIYSTTMDGVQSLATVGDRARQRITRRLLPYLLVLFLLAFLDRTNVAIAAVDMRKDLGFTDAVIGNGAGIFFLGYFLLEIPGTLIVERWSARKWIARIMVSWGIIAAMMGFIGLPIFKSLHLETQFNSLRFMLGLAEAGFFPGVIVYLSHWFRYEDRAKTKSLFLIGIPLATIISTPLSQAIMHNIRWMELAGWRWVFILEGIPAVIMGVVTWFYLTDRPEEAAWLPNDEKAWIVAQMKSEHDAKAAHGGDRIGGALLNSQVWLLSGIYLFAVTGMYGLTFFLPSIVDRMKGTSLLVQTGISTMPYVLGLIAILMNGAIRIGLASGDGIQQSRSCLLPSRPDWQPFLSIVFHFRPSFFGLLGLRFTPIFRFFGLIQLLG